MHQHRKVWPLIQSSYHPSRSAATATKIQPRGGDPSLAKPVNQGKWTPPSGFTSRSSLPGNSAESFQKEPSRRSTVSEPGVGVSLSTQRALDGKLDTSSEWTSIHSSSLPQGSRWVGPRASSSLTDPQLSSSSRVLNKWARRMPPASPSSKTNEEIQLQQQNPRSRPLTGDLQMQRDLGPHQNPSLTYKPRGNRFSQKQSGMSEPTPNLRVSLDSAIRDKLMPPRFERNTSQADAPRTDFTHIDRPRSRGVRVGWSHLTSHKERGSLLSRINEDVAPYSFQSSLNNDSIKVKKVATEKENSTDVYIPSTVSVGTLAQLLGVRLEILQRRMRLVGMVEEANYDHVLTSDYAALLVEEFGRNPVVNDNAAFDIYPPPPHPNHSSLKSRPPVVTIMGHVDHGKTTLLDSLRSSSVAKGEAGGITQHIGAFSVPVLGSDVDSGSPRSITFLDTPGHAAFSAMRARGAKITDIVVLVVASDDGIMPQTREVINLIKKEEGNLGVVVAINKIDKPGSNVDAVQKALLAEHIQLEAFGGDIPSVEVSGLTGHGLPTLMETLSAMAEMQDLRAEHDGPIQGYVLESKIHKGLGPVATILVLRGCLKIGAHVISSINHAKVRVMSDSTGAAVKVAYPGMAVTVSGWKTLPNVGDEVLQGTEAEVKKAVANRRHKAEIEATLGDVQVINSNRRQDRERRESELQYETKEMLQDTEKGPKELRLIIKADVSGSAEALQGALLGIGNKDAITRVVSTGVGNISESDVMMAKAIGGTIVGFSVSIARAIATLAAQNDVPIFLSNVIYRLMDDIKTSVIALLPATVETKVTGEATVLRLFDIQLKAKQMKKVAGCRVTNGLVEKGKSARLVRNGLTIHEGMLDTMRILKKDVTEVRKGSECGLCFGTAFGDVQEGDIIQVYNKIEKPGVL